MKNQKKTLEYAAAVKSFVGYLEGTSKSTLTVESYRSDLGTFEVFLLFQNRNRLPALRSLTAQHLELYHAYLLKNGLKANTRRRKLLTVRRFFRYLVKRNQLKVNISKHLPAPYKLEKIPETLSWAHLLASIQGMPEPSLIELRNKALVWTLAETGCLVSELCRIRFGDCDVDGIAIAGKNARTVPASQELLATITRLRTFTCATSKMPVFLGFNRSGPMPGGITPRGVELLLKTYGNKLQVEEMTPRLIRHSRVLYWLKNEAVTEEEVKKRLGWRSDYAFRVYRPMVKGDSK